MKSRNYRLYFIGQLVSLAGTWMQQIAMSWLVYRLTESALILGVMGFASQLPILLFAPLGGVWSDRFDRRRLLIWTQTLSMFQAVALAALVWTDSVSPGLLVAMAFTLGCINALDVPVRQSIVAQLVDDRSDLPNAIALNSFLMNAARFVGPALAGFAVVSFGEAVCFLINAFSYLAVIFALRAMDAAPPKAGRPSPALQALREGFVYAFGHREIRASLFVVAAESFLATPYAVMMPLFAREMSRRRQGRRGTGHPDPAPPAPAMAPGRLVRAAGALPALVSAGCRGPAACAPAPRREPTAGSRS